MLGCGKLSAALVERGGSRIITRLPDSRISFGRRLGEISDASVTVPVSAAIDSKTCKTDVLATLDAWEAELAIYRDGEPKWTGPNLSPEYTPDNTTISARDLFLWMERRDLRIDHDFIDEDLSDIFATLVSDALSEDPSPNIILSTGATGVLATRSVQAASARRAADELREIARSGLDWTMIGRQLLTGGPEIAGPLLPTLTDQHVRPSSARPRGTEFASRWIVLGANVAGSNVRGEAGGIDDRRGLVVQIANEPGILSTTEAAAAAASRLDFSVDPPSFVVVDILQNAPVSFDQLIPGARAPLAFRVGLREVIGTYRLVQVDVSQETQSPEKITATFAPLGSTE